MTAFSPIFQYIRHIFVFPGLQTNFRRLWFLVKGLGKEKIDTFVGSPTSSFIIHQTHYEKSDWSRDSINSQ